MPVPHTPEEPPSESTSGLAVDRGAGVPIGTQLASKLRDSIAAGTYSAGGRVPSVRELARLAGVNVNTARAVYGRLEDEGLLVSHQGRGTFVAQSRSSPPNRERAQLRAQIARLELELARRPPPPVSSVPPSGEIRAQGSLLSAEELARVRDDLLDRLESVDAARQQILRELASVKWSGAEAGANRGSTPSRAGARVRWLLGR